MPVKYIYLAGKLDSSQEPGITADRVRRHKMIPSTFSANEGACIRKERLYYFA
jgi:hypothetical protein